MGVPEPRLASGSSVLRKTWETSPNSWAKTITGGGLGEDEVWGWG